MRHFLTTKQTRIQPSLWKIPFHGHLLQGTQTLVPTEQNAIFLSFTSIEGHLYPQDTSIHRTPLSTGHLYPQDTSIHRTLVLVTTASLKWKFHCPSEQQQFPDVIMHKAFVSRRTNTKTVKLSANVAMREV